MGTVTCPGADQEPALGDGFMELQDKQPQAHGIHQWGGGTTQIPYGTGWAALMSGPWHPPVLRLPSCCGCLGFLPLLMAAHRAARCHACPTAPGTAWHWAPCAIHRQRCGLSAGQ